MIMLPALRRWRRPETIPAIFWLRNAAEHAALCPEYRPPEALILCAPRPEKGVKLEAALRGWVDLVRAP